MPNVAVAIPAHNAERTLSGLISGLSNYVKREDIFVVDDGSSDRTESVARELGVWLLKHSEKRGKGTALRDAVVKILELGYDLIVTMDSDLQHDPSELSAFIAASKNCDVVVGDRMADSKRMPSHRLLSNTITSRMISWRTRITIPDSQCGYRLYKAQVLKVVDSHCRYYDYESDILIKAALSGFKIGSVPIKAIYNDSKSNIRVLDILRFVAVYVKSFRWSNDKNPTP